MALRHAQSSYDHLNPFTQEYSGWAVKPPLNDKINSLFHTDHSRKSKTLKNVTIRRIFCSLVRLCQSSKVTHHHHLTESVRLFLRLPQILCGMLFHRNVCIRIPNKENAQYGSTRVCNTLCNHSVICPTTDPQPHPNPVVYRVRSSSSSFNFQHLHFSLRSSSSCLRLLPGLLLLCFLP